MAKKVTLPKKPAAEKKQAAAPAKKATTKTVAPVPAPAPAPIIPEIPIIPPTIPIIPEVPIIEKPIVCVVIPYVHDKAQGDELLYALRAWEKNLPNVVIVLVGDKPDFVAEEVLHIPGLSLAENGQIDVAQKLIQIIASDLVPNTFIFSNDDIYPVAPTTPYELGKLRCAGMLGDKKNATNGYLQKTLATKAILEEAGLKIYDYGTHLPVVYEKSSLAQVIEKYQAEHQGLLISSLYFNDVFPDEVPELTKGNATGDHVAYIYRSNPNIAVVEQAFANRKFINHNSEGYAPTLPFLKKQFPDKSRFEK